MPGRTSSTGMMSIGAATAGRSAAGPKTAASRAHAARARILRSELGRLFMTVEGLLHHADQVVLLRIEVLVLPAARVGQVGVEAALGIEEQDARDVLTVGAVAQGLGGVVLIEIDHDHALAG